MIQRTVDTSRTRLRRPGQSASHSDAFSPTVIGIAIAATMATRPGWLTKQAPATKAPRPGTANPDTKSLKLIPGCSQRGRIARIPMNIKSAVSTKASAA